MLLWRLKLRPTIPACFINNIKINENNEPLVDIKNDSTLYFSDELLERPAVLLRKSVYQKIKIAQTFLPDNYYFKIYSALRLLEEQTALWQKEYHKIKKSHPTLFEEQLIIKTKAVCADPRFGFGGHQTGGAVDISLCNKNQKEYDMGTLYTQISSKTPTKAKGLTQTQKKNRFILINVMEKAAFINYPNEWWHFCYGDRMWAAYSKRKECCYGIIQTNTLS